VLVTSDNLGKILYELQCKFRNLREEMNLVIGNLTKPRKGGNRGGLLLCPQGKISSQDLLKRKISKVYV